jgi:hypothetical protein
MPRCGGGIPGIPRAATGPRLAGPPSGRLDPMTEELSLQALCLVQLQLEARPLGREPPVDVRPHEAWGSIRDTRLTRRIPVPGASRRAPE